MVKGRNWYFIFIAVFFTQCASHNKAIWAKRLNQGTKLCSHCNLAFSGNNQEILENGMVCFYDSLGTLQKAEAYENNVIYRWRFWPYNDKTGPFELIKQHKKGKEKLIWRRALINEHW